MAVGRSVRPYARRTKSLRHLLLAVAVVTGLATAAPVAVAGPPGPDGTSRPAGKYHNPLDLRAADGSPVRSCADPTVIHGRQPGDRYWYLYCTTDPFSGHDFTPSGELRFHLIPTFRSLDLVHWTHTGDVFEQRPPWVASDAGLWAPEIVYAQGRYYLYYAASGTSLPGGGSAIGVATAPSPTGPWTDSGTPVVPPAPDGRWQFDPEVVFADGNAYLYFGSYFGGVHVRTLSADLLSADPASEQQIAIPNRYEGTNIVRHGGWYYFLGSATNCCNGPLTGYAVFAARSRSPLGPFVDRDGHSILEGRVGGTPVLTQNGNRWVGPGHNDVLTDFSGQDWIVYHAIDRHDPYFEGQVGFTRRPVLMDPLDWIHGWPVARGGRGPSDRVMPAPAAQPGERTTYHPRPVRYIRPGHLISSASDEFSGSTLAGQWSWVRQPDPATYGLHDGMLSWQTQPGDLYVDSNNASVLTEPAPHGNYMVETKVSLPDLPAEGCCHNYTQAGLVIYGDDDNFVKLATVSIWETRQTEFAKELAPVPDGYPRYGNTVVGPPGESTWLRIIRRHHGGQERYTAYTSPDGVHWDHGGTWTHHLGRDARIGLVSMAGSGFTATFDYVRVYRIHHRGSWR